MLRGATHIEKITCHAFLHNMKVRSETQSEKQHLFTITLMK